MTYTEAQIKHKLRTDERWLCRGILALASRPTAWWSTDGRFFGQLAEQIEDLALGAEDDPRRYEGTLSAEQERVAVSRIQRYAGALAAIANKPKARYLSADGRALRYGSPGDRLAAECDEPASSERRLARPVQWVVRFRRRQGRTQTIFQPTVQARSWQEARRKAVAELGITAAEYQPLGEERLGDTQDNPTTQYTPSAEELAELEPWLRNGKA